MENLTDQSEAELARIFTTVFVEQVNSQDVSAVLLSQENTIRRLDLTNTNLKNSINLSNEGYNAAVKDFTAHVQTLSSVKKDLDHIFKKLAIKTKLAKKYPEEYENAVQMFKTKSESEDEDELKVKNNENKNDNEKLIDIDQSLIETQNNTTSNLNISTIGSNSQQNNSTFFDFNIIKNAKNEINKIGASGKDLVDEILNKN